VTASFRYDVGIGEPQTSRREDCHGRIKGSNGNGHEVEGP
jgi:hypothetical protein